MYNAKKEKKKTMCVKMCVKQLFLKTKNKKKTKKQKKIKEISQHAKNIIGTNKRHNGKKRGKKERNAGSATGYQQHRGRL